MNTFHNITAQTIDISKKQLVCGSDCSKEICFFKLPVEHSIASWRMRVSSLSKWNSSCFELLLSGNREGMRPALVVLARASLITGDIPEPEEESARNELEGLGIAYADHPVTCYGNVVAGQGASVAKIFARTVSDLMSGKKPS